MTRPGFVQSRIDGSSRSGEIYTTALVRNVGRIECDIKVLSGTVS
jgi:hypothetical protein